MGFGSIFFLEVGFFCNVFIKRIERKLVVVVLLRIFLIGLYVWIFKLLGNGIMWGGLECVVFLE